MSCAHSKTCPDCYPPEIVRNLNSLVDQLVTQMAEVGEHNLLELEQLGARYSTAGQKAIDKQVQLCLVLITRLKPNWDRVPSADRYPRLSRLMGASNIKRTLDQMVDQ